MAVEIAPPREAIKGLGGKRAQRLGFGVRVRVLGFWRLVGGDFRLLFSIESGVQIFVHPYQGSTSSVSAVLGLCARPYPIPSSGVSIALIIGHPKWG